MRIGTIISAVVLTTFLLMYGCFRLGARILSTTMPASAAKTANAGRPADSWRYSFETDPLTNAGIKLACIDSENQADFAFPSSGGSTGTLCFRMWKGKLDAFFEVTKGQIMCSTDGCDLKIRLGDGPIHHFHALESRTGETNIVFLTDGPTLYRDIKRVKRMRIATDFYQNGENTFEFAPTDIDSFQFGRR